MRVWLGLSTQLEAILDGVNWCVQRKMAVVVGVLEKNQELAPD